MSGMNTERRPDEQQIRVAITGHPDMRDTVFEHLEGVVAIMRPAGSDGEGDVMYVSVATGTLLEFFGGFVSRVAAYTNADYVRQVVELALAEPIPGKNVVEQVLRP